MYPCVARWPPPYCAPPAAASASLARDSRTMSATAAPAGPPLGTTAPSASRLHRRRACAQAPRAPQPPPPPRARCSPASIAPRSSCTGLCTGNPPRRLPAGCQVCQQVARLPGCQ
eukprot:5397795-Prymnesium_polylepis.1